MPRLCTAALPARKIFLFRRPREWGRHCPPLFPSLKAMGEGYGEKLFYLTAKTITRRAAEEAFSILRERESLYFTAVTVTAKEKLCVREKAECNPDACPRAKGHFDRVNQAVYAMICRRRRSAGRKFWSMRSNFRSARLSSAWISRTGRTELSVITIMFLTPMCA